MDGSPKRNGSEIESAVVPAHLAEALDRSADDLRHGRVEDARAALARLERRLADHLASKRAAAGAHHGG